MNPLPFPRRNWLPPLLLLTITLLAVFLRLYRLDALPPGLYHDEAYNGLDALALLRGEDRPLFFEVWEQLAFAEQVEAMPHGRFPVFFVGNYGREPLFYYLLALSLAVAGARPLAIRLVPALSGVLVVLAVYWLARELLAGNVLAISPKSPAGRDARGRRVALLAALNVAIWYWLLHFSRFGIRPMLLALVAALAFACLARGLRTGRRIAWAAAGFWLGLSLYTYTPARMLPLAAFGWLAVVAWTEKGFLRRRWREWATFVAVAAIVVAPLGLFFLRYPEWAWFRAQYVATDAVGVEVESLGEMLVGNVGRVLGGLVLTGEKNLRHNLPGRPMLDPVQAIWLLLGLVLTTAQTMRALKSLTSRFQHHTSPLPPHASLLIWLPVMLLPTYLTSDAPHFGRAIGITPAVAVLMALGMDLLWRWGLRHKGATWAVALMLAVGLIYTGGRTVRDYFVSWAQHPGLDTAFQVDLATLGAYARSLPAEQNVYMTPPTEEYATILFTLGGTADDDRIRSFAGAAGAVPAGREGHAATYLIRPGDETSLSLLERRLPQGQVVETSPFFMVYRVPALAPRVTPSTPRQVNWANKVELLGYDLPNGPFRPGESVPVTVYWRALANMERPYTFFIHLSGTFNPATNGPLWSQHDAQPGDGTYPTAAWDVGEIVIDEYIVPLYPDIPPGEYELQAGFYYLPTLERLPVVDKAGGTAGDRSQLEKIHIVE